MNPSEVAPKTLVATTLVAKNQEGVAQKILPAAVPRRPWGVIQPYVEPESLPGGAQEIQGRQLLLSNDAIANQGLPPRLQMIDWI
mmetsp:Transcript_25921/g.39803  ORF Transcript_25921/g.39803 Transcript_25921/m.39803 type:complete len:85 (+) Transcript_25921:638-892(+)